MLSQTDDSSYSTKPMRYLSSNPSMIFQLYSISIFFATFSEDVKWFPMQEKINELMSELGSVGKAPNLQAPDRVEVSQFLEFVQKIVFFQPVITQPQVAADLSQFSVQLVDLQSAMSYMLYNEIPRREIISGNLLQYLKAWMHTLKKVRNYYCCCCFFFNINYIFLKFTVRSRNDPREATFLPLGRVAPDQNGLGHCERVDRESQ